MNRMVPTQGQPGDEVDALLTAFYRKEMPAPWPAFRPPISRAGTAPAAPTLPLRQPGPARSPVRGRPFWRSHFALAASVALLVFGTWCVPGLLPNHGARPAGESTTVPIDPRGGTATKVSDVTRKGGSIHIDVEEGTSQPSEPKK